MGEMGEINMDGVAEAMTVAGGPWSPVGPSAMLPEQLNVLLVEDDDADAYLVHRALQRNPRVQNIVRARDGVEALELLEEGGLRPDLAIIDLRMPRKDGFALLREIDQREDVDFPSIVLTSSRAGADNYRSYKRGARMVLCKPHTAEKLATVLNGAITQLS